MAYTVATTTPKPQANRRKTTRPARKHNLASAAINRLRLTLHHEHPWTAENASGKARLSELIGDP